MSDSTNELSSEVEPFDSDKEIDEAAIFIVNLAVELGENNQTDKVED